jgi:N-acylglucosamine 2-epimerase
VKPISDPIPALRAEQLCERYRSALLDDVVPWWERNIFDRECGSFYSCLERDGRPYAGDKFMWMNARAVWMFGHLPNRLNSTALD